MSLLLPTSKNFMHEIRLHLHKVQDNARLGGQWVMQLLVRQPIGGFEESVAVKHCINSLSIGLDELLVICLLEITALVKNDLHLEFNMFHQSFNYFVK